jgi:hypothetical protein
MAKLETQIPCLVLSEEELKALAKVGQWREDRHNLEAARAFGFEGRPDGFPSAFKRYQRPRSLIQSVRKAFSVGEHHTSTSAVDAKNIVSLRPNID